MDFRIRTIGIALAMLASQSAFSDENKTKKAVLSSPNGRYVLGQISDMRRDQFLLDTQTGRVWAVSIQKLPTPDGRLPTDDDPGYTVLDPVPFANGKGEDVDAKGDWFLLPQ